MSIINQAAIPLLDSSDVLPWPVPENLKPEHTNRMFPHATREDLDKLRIAGWFHMGVATAILNQSGEILMLEHAESEKTPEGALAPLMETVKVSPDEVESTEATIYRALQEELGVEDPRKLGLVARSIGAWTLRGWPVGRKQESERALGVNTVVVMPDHSTGYVNRFINTEEIRRAEFMSAEVILNSSNLRPGVTGWLGALTTARLLDRNGSDYSPVNFHEMGKNEDAWHDAILRRDEP